jgi:succinate dehydrogenase / fumarate reductase flavoprotein subunit
LLLGAYSALSRQVANGKVKLFPRTEMMDLVMVDGHARGIVTRNLITGAVETHAAHAVLLCTGGYGNVFFLSTNAMGSNVTAAWRAHKKGALFANPCFTQIHPTCIPVSGDHQSKLTLMSESLRNDGRVWVPKTVETAEKLRKKQIKPADIKEDDRDYFLERKYPSFGNLVPRDVASRNAKYVCDEGRGVNETGEAVFLDFRDAIARDSEDTIRARYGNLFDMYQQITGENPYKTPMMIYPAVHYTMGGLWVDYNLMTNIPGLYALGEANFSDHGANRLGASALMQGLADGYFVVPYTIGDYLAQTPPKKVDESHPAFAEAVDKVKGGINQLLNIKGSKTVDHFHKRLGKIMWNECGMARTAEGLKEAKKAIKALKKEFWSDVKVLGENEELNQSLEKANRVADFIELGELMIDDALNRNESCGGHFREEYQTPEGEALRDDENFAYVAAWKFMGEDQEEELVKEPLEFENVKLTQRSYK